MIVDNTRTHAEREELLAAERAKFADGTYSEAVFRASLFAAGLRGAALEEQVDLATMEWITNSKKETPAERAAREKMSAYLKR